jgi:hypothetical protein
MKDFDWFWRCTNDRFSIPKISGYTGYGTKDGTLNIVLSCKPSTNTNTWLNVSYTDDVREIGTTLFSVDKDHKNLRSTTYKH